MRASTGPRQPAVWEAAADECGLCLNLFTRFVGGNVYFLGQRRLAHQSLESWRYFALCSASCVAFGCRSWAQTLLEKKNAAHTHTLTHKQSKVLVLLLWIELRAFGWPQTEKLVWAFLCFIFHSRFGWNSFVLLFLPLRQDYWGLNSKSTSSSRPVWLAFHAEVRSKLKLFEYFKKNNLNFDFWRRSSFWELRRLSLQRR